MSGFHDSIFIPASSPLLTVSIKKPSCERGADNSFGHELIIVNNQYSMRDCLNAIVSPACLAVCMPPKSLFLSI